MSTHRKTIPGRTLSWTGLNSRLRRVLWLLREAASLNAYVVLNRDEADARKLCCNVVPPSTGSLLFYARSLLKGSDLPVEVYPLSTWVMRRNSILQSWLADWKAEELVLAVNFGPVITAEFEWSGEDVAGQTFEILVGLKEPGRRLETPLTAQGLV